MFNVRMCLVVGAVLAVACGTGSEQPGGSGGGTTAARSDELYTSGTRLKVRSIVGTDGSKQQVTLFDSLLSEPCSFRIASDGSLRCLPLPYLTGTYFSGTSCTSEVLFRGNCDQQAQLYGATHYGFLANSASCQPGPDVYKMSDTPYVGPVSLLANGVCLTLSQTEIQASSFYASSGVAPPSTFVQGSISTDP
jgi:hypothetical protein